MPSAVLYPTGSKRKSFQRAPAANLTPTAPIGGAVMRGAPVEETPPPVGAKAVLSGAADLDIPEPAFLVGALTKQKYGLVGDSPYGDETLTVTPPSAIMDRGKPTQTAGGIPSFQTGGTITAGADDYSAFSPATQAALRAAQGGGALAPQTGVGVTAGGAAPVSADPLAQQLAATQAVNRARGAELDAQGRVIGAGTNVLQAQQQTFGPASAVIRANEGVIGGQERVTAGQRGLTGAQIAENAMQQQELSAIQRAGADVGDKAAVARAQQYRNTMDQRYDIAGVARPIDIETPSGADTGEALPPGVRAAYRTSEALLTDRAQDRQALVRLGLEAQKLGVDLLSLDVDDLRHVANRAGIALDDAELLVDRARNQAAFTEQEAKALGLDTQRARLRADELELGPAGTRLYTYDDGTSAYLTPGEVRRYEAERNRAFGLEQAPANAAQRRALGLAEAGAETAYEQQVSAIQTQVRGAESGFGALTVGQLLSGVTDGSITEGVAVAELVRRGYPQNQAQTLVAGARPKEADGDAALNAAIEEYIKRQSQGGTP